MNPVQIRFLPTTHKKHINMTKKEEMIFEQNRLGITNIQCVSYGQPRAYADSLFKWNITTNTKVDRNELLKFCQKYLRYNTNPYENWQKLQSQSALEYFKGYYNLSIDSDTNYRYEVMEPFCD